VPSKARLGAIIAAALPDAELVRHKPLEGGVSADVTMLELAFADGTRRKCVLREQGERHGGNPAQLEFETLKALHALGLPVPRPRSFGEGGPGLPFVLIDYVEGTTHIPKAETQTRIATMADQLAAFHAASTGTFPDLPLRTDPQPELLDFLAAEPGWTELRQWVQRVGPQPFRGATCVLHGDYWPLNVIWQGSTIAAVIDWEDAALGDPVSDVACAMLEMRYAFGLEGANHFLDAYTRHRHVDPVRLAWWQAYVAASGVKSMGGWGLDAEREAHMRAIAMQCVADAARTILQ